MHLDHIYSIFYGFKNNICPWVIAHPSNLRLISNKINCSKKEKCDLTKEELFNNIKKHTNFFDINDTLVLCETHGIVYKRKYQTKAICSCGAVEPNTVE